MVAPSTTNSVTVGKLSSVVTGLWSKIKNTFAAKSHTHGNIQNGGTLQTSDVAIANGDKLVVTDASDSSKVARTSLAFDGSTTGYLLSKKGTFEQPREAYLAWGGQNLTGGYGPIDAAMVPQLGANRFSNLWKGVSVEYTRDGGTTWIDYGLTDADKRTFFTKTYSLVIGKADSTNKATTAENYSKYKLRITLDKTAGTNVYTELRKFILDVSTAGSASCYMVVTGEYRSGDNYVWKTLGEMGLDGWNGYNVFNTYFIFGNYGDTVSSGQYRKLVFLFETRAAGNTSYTGLSIRSIYAYGGVGWTTPSIMASTGHLYAYDGDQNATFPALVTATKFVGPLMGNADTATTATNYNTTTGNIKTALDGKQDVLTEITDQEVHDILNSLT